MHALSCSRIYYCQIRVLGHVVEIYVALSIACTRQDLFRNASIELL